MSLKSILENNPTLIILGTLLAGFLGGVGTMEFLEKREKELRAQLIAEIREENSRLKVSNDQLDTQIREVLVKYIDQNAIISGKPLGGENSEVRKLVKQLDHGEISNVIKEPGKIFKDLF